MTRKDSVVQMFTRSNLESIRSEMEKVLNEHFRSKGIAFILGRIRFEPTHFKAALEAILSNGNENAQEEIWEKNFYEQHSRYNIPRDWLGKWVGTTKHGLSKIVGLAPNKKKYPIVLKHTHGYICCTPQHARNWFLTH